MLSLPMLEDTDVAENHLRGLEDMFPDVDPAVIQDVYDAYGQDPQRTMQALWAMTGGVSTEDMPDMSAESPYYEPPGYDSDFMLGHISIAEWTAKLESISWQDAVAAVTDTLSTVGTNVSQGLTTLAESLSTWVSDLSGGSEEYEEGQRERRSEGTEEGAPQQQGMQRNGSARISSSDGSMHMRRHQAPSLPSSSNAYIGSGASSSRSGVTKKDD